MKRKNKISIIATILFLALAVPFWVGALVNQPPTINKFVLGEESKLEPDEKVFFEFETYDKEDDKLYATLYYGDGEKDRFNIYDDEEIVKSYRYNKDGDYRARLKIEDQDGARTESSFELTIGEGGVVIDEFRMQDRSNLTEPGGRVYFQYRVCGPDENDLDATLYFGDGEKVEIDDFCTTALESHKYEKYGQYEAELVAESNGTTERETIDVVIWLMDNEMPKADFEFSPDKDIEVGEKVKFTNLSEDPDHVSTLDYNWNFGDGVTSEAKNPRHIYKESGTYKVTLEVKDSGGLKDKKWTQFYVYPERQSGKLVRVPGREKIWRIKDGRRHWIPSPAAFFSYGFNPDNVESISAWRLEKYDRVDHIKLKGDSGRIFYITDSGLLRQIPNLHVFYSYGNKLDEVVEVTQAELDSYERVKTIKYDNSSRIYALERPGSNIIKRWIKTPEAFEAHGFEWNKVAPVNWTELHAYPTGETIN